MEHVFGLLVGIGLSAACGCRIFVPLLGMSIAHATGHLSLSPGFEWIGSWPAIVAFSVATIVEVLGYYIPWVDNVLDVAAAPAAITAATILTASQVGGMSPMLKWSLAAIAGGGACAIVQTGTTALRAASTGTTGGFGNFLVATSELVVAGFVTIAAIVAPFLCAMTLVLVCAVVCYKLMLAKRTVGVGQLRADR